ncbi:MAG: M3 family metallopeptidase [Schleiferiaceae bacterium]
MDNHNNNPLLQPFSTPFNTPPFTKIEIAHYLPALKEAIKEGKAEVDHVISKAPTFENTIVGLDNAGKRVGLISGIFFNLNTAETSEEMQELAKEISPLLSEYGNDIMLNADLFKAVETVYKNTDLSSLSDEDSMLLIKTYKSFVRNGAGLNEEEKSQLRAIDIELSKATLTFSENVLADTNDYVLWLTEENQLAGLPDYAIQGAAQTAKEKGKEGQWAITLQMPSYIPFMTYSEVRELRKELFLAKGKVGNSDNDNNNIEWVKTIVDLRQKRARLLGYTDHASFTLEERMAKNAETVNEFLADLLTKAQPAGKRDYETVEAFAKDLDRIEALQKWDFSYYSEKLKLEKFNIDDNLLKPYFSLENVETGAFDIAGRLYGLQFVPRPDIEGYHPDVKAYEVLESNGDHLAVFYTDYHPRAGKKNGAWMTSYLSSYHENGKDVRPHISIVCNFSPPSGDTPSLLTFQEVTTLFHEFGHALHGMLGKGKYASLTGTSVFWDFVELPSQIMENWCYQKESLNEFAKHYKTGEALPTEWMENLVKSANFMEGYATLRQLSFGLLDMAWYGNILPENYDVAEIEKTAMAPTDLFPEVEGTMMSTAFNHIFPGGYSAGYYSYKWAEVLDADAFEAFLENGLYDSDTAQSFKVLLESGGSIHPMTLFENFRGRKPKVDALLKRAGIANA